MRGREREREGERTREEEVKEKKDIVSEFVSVFDAKRRP
jgi:hypothetical protein